MREEDLDIVKLIIETMPEENELQSRIVSDRRTGVLKPQENPSIIGL